MNKKLRKAIVSGIVLTQLLSQTVCFAQTKNLNISGIKEQCYTVAGKNSAINDVNVNSGKEDSQTMKVGDVMGFGCQFSFPIGGRVSYSAIEWKVSNKKVVDVIKTSGGDFAEIVVKAKKEGTCKIKGICHTIFNNTMGGQYVETPKDFKSKEIVVFDIKLNVIKKDVIQKYTGKKTKVSLVKFNNKNYNIDVKICNGSKKTISYTDKVVLKKLVKGKWKVVLPELKLKEYGIEYPKSSAYRLKGQKSVTRRYVLTDNYDKKNLKKGTYRFYVDFTVPKNTTKYIEFKIK